MAYKLRVDESVAHGLRRVAIKEARAMRATLGGKNAPRDAAVHEARKSLKKLRVIARLIRHDDGGGVRGSSRALKRINRVLSQLRDASETLETFSKLEKSSPGVVGQNTLAHIRKTLEAHRRHAFQKAMANHVWTDMRKSLVSLEQDVKKWKPAHRDFKALSRGIHDAHREGRRARRVATRSHRARDFHELRKAIKSLWYQVRLLAPLGPSVRRQATALDHAQSWLGDDHNLDVLCTFLARRKPRVISSSDFARVQSASTRSQRELRKKALTAVRAIYATSSRLHVRRLKRAWRAVRAQG